MKKVIVPSLVIIILSFIIGLYLYNRVPEMMASHWGAQGEVNGYMPRFWGVFLMPIISAAMLLLFMLIPIIDPLKANIKKFRKYYDWFILLIIIFMFYIYMLTILRNLGFRFSMVNMLLPALGILFFYAGVLIENAKRNWSIGIRTPWTMSDEKVWEKTNKLGGKLFKISGIIAFLGLFFQKYAFLLFIVPIIISAIYLIFYSYFEYSKRKNKNRKIKKTPRV